MTEPLETPLPSDPLALLGDWIRDAETALARENPTAMTLATATPEGRPDARMVICRGFDLERGWIVFYTDQRSAKAQQLDARPHAAGVFYWNALERQIRIEGPVTRAPEAQADAYFAGRPAGSQLGAWISEQSRPLQDRALLDQRFAEKQAELGVDDLDTPAAIPRPEFWGGYRIWIERMEFWVGMRSRLHDRALYRRELERDGDGFNGASWSSSRLWP